MCFHPWSDVTLPLMKKHEVVKVIDKWAELVYELGAVYPWVQVRHPLSRTLSGTLSGTCSDHSDCQPSLQFFILIFFYWLG